jgi:hypothetical protein
MLTTTATVYATPADNTEQKKQATTSIAAPPAERFFIASSRVAAEVGPFGSSWLGCPAHGFAWGFI